MRCAYDIIGDIHGHADELKALRDSLGYQRHGDGYRHLEREVVFVGDFVDHDPAASSDWAILSPDVPVSRKDAAMEHEKPWPLSFLTCAAAYAPAIGRLNAEPMLRKRIHRVREIARAYEYESLVMVAWGCGVFANDPLRTAMDFQEAHEGDFAGAFSDVIFAITDWSEQRKYLRPFCDVLSED